MSSSIPTCNYTINGESYYSSAGDQAVGAIGNVVGGFFGMVINSILLFILIIIYLFTRSSIVLFFLMCSLFGLLYSIYQIYSTPSKYKTINDAPPRPCVNNLGVILS